MRQSNNIDSESGFSDFTSANLDSKSCIKSEKFNCDSM
jgi:hypothetical protein